GIDLSAVDELVEINRARGFERDVLQLLLRHLDERVLVERVAFDDVLIGDLVARVGIDLEIFDAVPSLPVELVERNLLALGGGGVERDRAGHEREPQEAFPVGSGGHLRRTPNWTWLGFKTIRPAWFRQ